ncbi:hypothetical protein GCM10022226_46710 [Sphaerisporangium flaviroseum]|uniref:Uncharacterized protein n=1 Tax=Sphaerisporangium flaviroseum TaxID=509199 RepID=A0ABP7IL30_9ACTN
MISDRPAKVTRLSWAEVGRKVHVTAEPLVPLTTARRAELDEQVERVGEILEGRPELTIGTVTVGGHAYPAPGTDLRPRRVRTIGHPPHLRTRPTPPGPTRSRRTSGRYASSRSQAPITPATPSKPGLCTLTCAGATLTPATLTSWQLNAVNAPASAARNASAGAADYCQLPPDRPTRPTFPVTALADPPVARRPIGTGAASPSPQRPPVFRRPAAPGRDREGLRKRHVP